MIINIGWKNVWRNKTRSLVVIVAVMLGIFSGVLAAGIMKGWIDQKIYSSIHNEISHIQIHNPDFMLNEELQHTVRDYDKVVAVLDTTPGILAYSKRVKVFAMAQTDWGASGFMIKGIDPEKEKEMSEIHLNLIEGEYFENNHRMPSIVIGSKAAENLKLLNYQVTPEKIDSIDSEVYSENLINKIVGIGERRFRKEKDFRNALEKALSESEYKEHADKLVKYFSFYRLRSKIALTIQSTSGDLTNATFRVRGIFKTDNSMFDGMTAFVEKKELNRYTGLAEDQVHEFAILCSDDDAAISISKKLSDIFPKSSVLSYRQISPEIALYTKFSSLMGYIYVGIILFALAFGIINTMLMAIMERIKELGMLMAIGMNKKRVFSMIMIESVFLTLTGALVGMFLSGVAVNILGKTGINFGMWAEGFEALGYSAIVYPVVSISDYIGITILVIITGIVSSIWPARKALKLNPAEAIRIE